MSPEEQAARLRIRVFELLIRREKATIAALQAGTAMEAFADAWTEAEARELAQHPDLAELNAQMKGFYGED